MKPVEEIEFPAMEPPRMGRGGSGTVDIGVPFWLRRVVAEELLGGTWEARLTWSYKFGSLEKI